MGPNVTIREKIMRILLESKSALSARELAEIVGLDPATAEKQIYEHLKHITKTLRRKYGRRAVLYMIPPRCKNCGYEFRDLSEPRRPSRCPKCRSQRIEPPRFYVSIE